MLNSTVFECKDKEKLGIKETIDSFFSAPPWKKAVPMEHLAGHAKPLEHLEASELQQELLGASIAELHGGFLVVATAL